MTLSQHLVPALTRDQRGIVTRGPVGVACSTIGPMLVQRLRENPAMVAAAPGKLPIGPLYFRSGIDRFEAARSPPTADIANLA